YPLSEKSLQLATKIGKDKFAPVRDAVAQSDVIVVATPPEAIAPLVPELGKIEGKTVIDATNSVRTRPEPYRTGFQAIKGIAKIESVVKCFNTTGFENMLDPNYGGQPIDMFMAGSDKGSKAIAAQLARDIGFGNCYDFGGDDKVELLEQFALCWINLAIMQGVGRNIAFRVVRR
ncbi:MAG TPA: NAD(P)-binding domain-containing protein, partial [Cyclobacteriaceae bacterium]|nr:NAD(P)-binding domain-containing protein [Cyclobacteriaceae bacterium]